MTVDFPDLCGLTAHAAPESDAELRRPRCPGIFNVATPPRPNFGPRTVPRHPPITGSSTDGDFAAAVEVGGRSEPLVGLFYGRRRRQHNMICCDDLMVPSVRWLVRVFSPENLNR